MKNLICSAVAILFAVSAAQAQQAVQWRVQDGGNGHWYQGVSPSPLVSWFQAKHRAEQVGGHLTTFGTAAEHAFVYQHIASDPRYWHLHQTCGCMSIGPWIGLRRENGFWSWVTGEPVTFTSWHPSEPWEPLDFVRFFHYVAPLTPAPLWDNFESGEPGGDPSTPTSYLVEWSADCNNDGIVDYGQCLDGTLPDTNGNNIPDCCETGEACVVGNYPVQWRVEDGGNGHWYQLRYTSDLRWETANIEAQLLGGHLAIRSDCFPRRGKPPCGVPNAVSR